MTLAAQDGEVFFTIHSRLAPLDQVRVDGVRGGCALAFRQTCGGKLLRHGPLSTAIPRTGAGGLKPEIDARAASPAPVATASKLSKIGDTDLGRAESHHAGGKSRPHGATEYSPQVKP